MTKLEKLDLTVQLEPKVRNVRGIASQSIFDLADPVAWR